MRELLDEIFDQRPLDPVEAARRHMRTSRRRFYASADVAETNEGFVLELDGRPVKTPARRVFSAPTAPLAEAVAAEWNAQGEFIEPARMPLTRLANTVIDGVADARAEVVVDVAKYLTSDLLFYRAGEPPRLVARQAQHWDPVLAWAREALGARFVLVEGVTFVAQPDSALAAARSAIPDHPWRLGAVHAVTTLTGSALLALMFAHGAISLEAAWTAAHVDEDWNMELWGRDEMALERRACRFAEMQAAATVLRFVP